MTDETPATGTPTAGPTVARRTIWMVGGAAVLLFALGVWLVVAKLPVFLSQSTIPDSPTATTKTATTGGGAEARRIMATLFFVSPDGMELVPLGREVLYGATPDEQARRIVEAQVAAPADDQRSAIPAGTTVRNVFLTENGEAYVDLGGTIVSGHGGGSLDEALAVYAIVNALTTNMPNVTSVQILVEGKEVDTLVGHLDLRFPLGKALEWVRKGQ